MNKVYTRAYEVNVQVIFDHADYITKTIRMFWFQPARPVHYSAGQFIELRLPHTADTRGEKRWFTLTSSPTETMLAITTKLAPTNGSTFKQTLANLKPGDTVTMSEPMGDFVLPKDSSIELVFVAGGIGITPMRSMIKWLVDSHQRRPISLIYAVSQPDELAFIDLFEQSNVKFIPVIKQTNPSWHGANGTLDSARILELASPSEHSLFFISGPEPMVEALGNSLHQHGISKNHIVIDYFPGYIAI